MSLPASLRERMAPASARAGRHDDQPVARSAKRAARGGGRPSRDPWQWVLGAGLFVVAVAVLSARGALRMTGRRPAASIARMPRLRRTSPDDPGWTRRRAGKGFVYLDESGERLRTTRTRSGCGTW